MSSYRRTENWNCYQKKEVYIHAVVVELPDDCHRLSERKPRKLYTKCNTKEL